MSEALQSGNTKPEPARTTPLHVFAAALIGKPFDLFSARVVALVAYAKREAAQRIESGRASVDKRSLLPYAVLYEDLKAEASRTPAPYVPKSASLRRRTLGAVCALRHRQRAAVLLRFSAGFLADEVAEVLKIRPQQVEEIVHAAAGRIAAAMGRPVDLATALRLRQAPGKPDRATLRQRPARLPRGVVRTLVAPPPATAKATEFVQRPTPVETIVRAAVLQRIEIRDEVAPPPPKRALPWKRVALAAACVAVMLLALMPVSASNRTGAPAAASSAWQVNLPPVQPAAAAPARVAVVRRGDTLWSMAARSLGDAQRWREIWKLNLGRSMTFGERFVDPDLIKPGWQLRLPSR